MGIYASNRTTLLFTSHDDEADFKILEGYESMNDALYIINEVDQEDVKCDQFYRFCLAEASDERNRARFIAIWKGVQKTASRTEDKLCSVCTSTSNKLNKFYSSKVSSMFKANERRFTGNVEAATSKYFSIAYDKNLLTPYMEKKFDKKVAETQAAFTELIENATVIASRNYDAINKGKIASVKDVSKYTNKFFSISDYKSNIVAGNPFVKTGYSTTALYKEMKNDPYVTGKCSINKMNATTTSTYKKAHKNAEMFISKAQAKNNNVILDDIKIATATSKVLNYATAMYIKAIRDIAKVETKHIAQNIKLFNAVAKMKQVKHESGIVFTASEKGLIEASNIIESLNSIF